MSFDVDCPASHAFDVWTTNLVGWPADHSVSGEHGLLVVLRGRPGGRIFERTWLASNSTWGEVTVWDRQATGYLWHLRQERADATEVEITFVDQGDLTTCGSRRTPRLERLGARLKLA